MTLAVTVQRASERLQQIILIISNMILKTLKRVITNIGSLEGDVPLLLINGQVINRYDPAKILELAIST